MVTEDIEKSMAKAEWRFRGSEEWGKKPPFWWIFWCWPFEREVSNKSKLVIYLQLSFLCNLLFFNFPFLSNITSLTFKIRNYHTVCCNFKMHLTVHIGIHWFRSSDRTIVQYLTVIFNAFLAMKSVFVSSRGYKIIRSIEEKCSHGIDISRNTQISVLTHKTLYYWLQTYFSRNISMYFHNTEM